jgi:geranyl-CoA carboxylase alpha subunit
LVTKLLIANRGEIACRVLATAHSMGLATVAVYSDADADAPHVAMADQAVHIGPAEASQSYLDAGKILEAAARTGADAIHPGYGFLSENAAFARACAEAGVTFVGPGAEAIEVMGDKARAKTAMEAADVPTVPGYRWEDQAGESLESLATEAERIGFPLLVKAIAGGGGRGMRRVDGPEDLEGALGTARSEAKNAFGCGDLMLERLVEGARHVEIQVMADGHGQVIHLGERDCSIQRRHQKVIEEAPSPAVSDELRARMGAAACAAAKAVDYIGAGTVEFLLDGAGEFYFLEMNTRLQVEHPVTELVTDLDLVELQLRVAAGGHLEMDQEDVELVGHAMEARLYAEDPERGFLPQAGRAVRWEPAEGEGVRVDHGLSEGQEITAHYDPMVAKVIAWGGDREEARRRLDRALSETTLLGLTNNGPFLRQVLSHETFVAGEATTDFLERELGAPEIPLPEDHLAIAAALWLEDAVPARASGVWRSTGSATSHLKLAVGGEVSSLRIGHSLRRVGVIDGDRSWQVLVLRRDPDGTARVVVDSVQRTVRWAREGEVLHLDCGGGSRAYREAVAGGQERSGGSGETRAPMSGKILAVHVAVGDAVSAGDALLTMEAMKLETKLVAELGGRVAEVRVGAGEQVQGGDLLVALQTEETEETEETEKAP